MGQEDFEGEAPERKGERRLSLRRATLFHSHDYPHVKDQSKQDELSRIEALIEDIQSPQIGIEVRNVSVLFNKLTSVFNGYEMAAWLRKRLELSREEALHLGKLLFAHGYIYSLSSNIHKFTGVKGDFYRFQDHKYWPSNRVDPGDREYAIYLNYRALSRKARYALKGDEQGKLKHLRENLSESWNAIVKEAKYKLAVDGMENKNKVNIQLDQLRAFWHVYRPKVGLPHVMEENVIKIKQAPVIDDYYSVEMEVDVDVSEVQEEIDQLSSKLEKMDLAKPSQVANRMHSCIAETIGSDQLVQALDPKYMYFVEAAQHKYISDTLSWSVSFGKLLKDPNGIREFRHFLEKEHSVENLDFWLECKTFKGETLERLPSMAAEMYLKYVHQEAKNAINIDSKARQGIEEGMKELNRYCFDDARNQIYKLMKTDSYARFIKSEQYMKLVKEESPSSRYEKESFHNRRFKLSFKSL